LPTPSHAKRAAVIRCDLWQAVPVSQAKQKRLIQPLDQKLFVARYLVVLPSMEKLCNFLKTDRERIESLMPPHPTKKSTRPRTKP
jgi:hypothetical protein